MGKKTRTRLMFLAWECPWPARFGGALRSLGLLKELATAYEIDLVVLSRRPLSVEQTEWLRGLTEHITVIPMKDMSFRDKLRAVALMLASRCPYHCAVVRASFQQQPLALRRIREFAGVIYASYGQWGTLAHEQAHNWILDQQNADIDFWRVYASQASNYLTKVAALINWRLSNRHFRRIYGRVGRIVSVCEDDRQLTKAVAPQVRVDVIANGVDCAHYVPNKVPRSGPPRLLFTGTSAARNMTALRQFVRNVFPLILQEMSDIELMVAGNFTDTAQREFRENASLRFTGLIDDIRPFFDQSDVYIAPFQDTHGSKLKIAEAMAMGMAIVSTPAGIRGFPLTNGESVLLAHDNQEFAAHVLALLADPVRRQHLGAAARDVALSSVDWRVLSQRLVQTVEAVSRAVPGAL